MIVAWLIDTNILSEPVRVRPDQRATEWVAEHIAQNYTAAFCIAEIRYGIELLPEGARKTRFDNWLAAVENSLGDRILRFDTRVAHLWGRLQARLEKAGTQIELQDSYIAAIAERHNLIIATRNTADFDRAGLRTFNPFATT